MQCNTHTQRNAYYRVHHGKYLTFVFSAFESSVPYTEKCTSIVSHTALIKTWPRDM